MDTDTRPLQKQVAHPVGEKMQVIQSVFIRVNPRLMISSSDSNGGIQVQVIASHLPT
jgi:hypothetical protein